VPSVTAIRLTAADTRSDTAVDQASAPSATTSKVSSRHTCGTPKTGATTFLDLRRAEIRLVTGLRFAQAASGGYRPSDPSPPGTGSSIRPRRSGGTALPAPKRLA
jgi:hypothetical protein